MKRKQILLRKPTVLLSAVLLAAGVCACGAGDSAPSEPETADSADTVETTETENETEEQQTDDAADAGEESDTDAAADTDNGETAESPITVTFHESLDEIKADDGTVILTSSVKMPIVTIPGAEDIAEKINADIAEYYSTLSNDETVSMAQEDYAASQGEDGWDFRSYSADTSAKVTRMDDAVLSYELISSAYTGGAHGNYGSVGRNYDMKTGELLSFDEIAEDADAFHAAVLDYMVNLAETPAYKDRLFGPSKEDLESTLFEPGRWLFTSSGISLLADPYALGPYASGEIYFMLPYEKAYELGLKENYRYNGSFVDERYYVYQYDPETFEPVVDGTPDYSFDLDGDGEEEGIAFYGYVTDPATGSGRYAFYIDGKDYGDAISDAVKGLEDNGYLESTYALYQADTPDGSVPAVAILFTEFENDEDGDGNPDSHPYSYIFGYTKEKGLYYIGQEEGYVTLPAQS